MNRNGSVSKKAKIGIVEKNDTRENLSRSHTIIQFES